MTDLDAPVPDARALLSACRDPGPGAWIVGASAHGVVVTLASGRADLARHADMGALIAAAPALARRVVALEAEVASRAGPTRTASDLPGAAGAPR